jgi:hypothetical protein
MALEAQTRRAANVLTGFGFGGGIFLGKISVLGKSVMLMSECMSGLVDPARLFQIYKYFTPISELKIL